MLPPLHIAVFKQAEHDPSFKVGLTDLPSRDVDENKSFTSFSDTMAFVLDCWKVDLRIFTNITLRKLREKLLLTERVDVTEALQSATAIFKLVCKPFADTSETLAEPLTREEMCCVDRYFDIVLLGEESSASHFLYASVSL